MPCRATLAQLMTLLNATPFGISDTIAATQATEITTDSRHLSPGAVFVALRGEKFDGHDFVAAAIAAGAIAAIVDTEFSHSNSSSSNPSASDLPLLQVPDTLAAYQAIGCWWRQQFSIPVIAVTGSVGKTTTKELIAAVLGQHGTVHKSAANYNNEIGVPKTLLELDTNHQFAVVEMGMRGRGEIALLTQIAQPDIAVITNVGTAHIERLGSEEAIAQAKCELLAEMPANGLAVLNHDTPLLLKTADRLWHGRTLTYGLQGGDLHGHLIDGHTLRVEGHDLPLPLPGQHNALNYLAAIAVAKALHLDWAGLTKGLQITLPAGRAGQYTLPGDVVILDETYNAGLESMLASLHLLAQTPAQRRIAVLGTMRELGDRSPEFHQRVGEQVRSLKLDGLLILADKAEAEALAKGAAPLVAERFDSHAAVVERLKELVRSGDRVLFKASRAVGLDQVVEQFRASYEASNRDAG